MQRYLSAVVALLLLSVAFSAVAQLPEESDESPRLKRGANNARGIRPTIPLSAASAVHNLGTPGAGAAAVVSAPPPAPIVAAPIVAANPAAAGAGTKEDLPLPGEKEFTECKRIPPGRRLVVSLKPDSELIDLIGWIKTISCRPFIIPSSIRQQKVTIVVPEAITAAEAYRIFLSALESMGLTVQPEGKVLKIIESNRARESSIPVIGPTEEPPQNEQYVTRMLRLKYVYPDEVVQVLNRLKGRDGDITPYAATNTLIITDLSSNIRRMQEVVRSLDVPMGGEKIWVIRLRSVSAGEMAGMLQQIFGVTKGGAAGAGAPPRRAPLSISAPTSTTDVTTTAPAQSDGGDLSISQIIPDERTNSLIIVSTEKTYQRVLALVKRLEDVGTTAPGTSVHVYPLENANSEDVGAVLQGLGVSVSAGGGRRAGSTSSSGGRPGGLQGAQPGATPQAGGGGGGLFQEEVRVTSDKGTNSLVVLSSNRDYLTLRDVIRHLDIPRRQVYIEAAIMEIGISNRRDLGAAYHGVVPAGPGVFGFQEKSSDLNSLFPLSTSGLAGLAGFIGPLLQSSSVLGPAAATLPEYGALLQALQTNNNFNILQAPHILTTDNEKATIQVGQNLPFPSSSFGSIAGAVPGAGGALGGIPAGTSVQRQDVALKLDITPHVNASDFVRLEIENEISDVADPNYNNLGPATNKRTLKTVAVVRDQQAVVLGGILRDTVRESENKIPILGDIPILGYLFKFKSKQDQKQMLIVVITPYIISSPDDLRRIFERKMQERRDFIERNSVFTSEKDFDRFVDYTRKRGALEEINRTAQEAERDALDLHAAEVGLRRDVEGGPVELPVPALRGGGAPAAAPPVSPSLPNPSLPSPSLPSPSLPPPPASIAPPGAPSR